MLRTALRRSLFRRLYSSDHRLKQMSSTLSQDLKSLESLTAKVENVIKAKASKVEEIKERETKKDLIDKVDKSGQDLQQDPEQDVQDVLDSLVLGQVEPFQVAKQIGKGTENGGLNLFPTPKAFVNLPKSITESISPKTLGYLTSPTNANWAPLVTELISKTEDLSLHITPVDFHDLVHSIPKSQRESVVLMLHELAIKSGVADVGNESQKRLVLNDLLALCVHLPVSQAEIVVGKVLEDFDTAELATNTQSENDPTPASESQNTKLVTPNVITKTILLNHYARMKSPKQVQTIIADLNTLPADINPLTTTPVIYTNVMQMYVRLGQPRLARETFDTMTFLSTKTAPSSRTCTSMILTDTLNNDIEHAMEVYNNMKTSGTSVEPDALLALAKGCGTRGGSKTGPQMIIQGWSFIIQYYNQGHPINERVMEIMMYLASVDSDVDLARAILINVIEQKSRGKSQVDLSNLRLVKWLYNAYYKKLLGGQSVGFMDDKVRVVRNRIIASLNFTFSDAPPLLPQVSLDRRLIVPEGRALWKYLNDRHVQLSPEVYEAYLYLLGMGDMNLFKLEWQKKMFTNDRIYCAALHIARHKKDIEFAKVVWEERGKYRLQEEFQQLKARDQDMADFKFARLMMSLFVTCGELDDAFRIILSSKRRFKWNYYHVKSLITLCERLGAVGLKREILKVVDK